MMNLKLNSQQSPSKAKLLRITFSPKKNNNQQAAMSGNESEGTNLGRKNWKAKK